MKKLFDKQPFQGKPKARLSYDSDGNPRFDVTIKELTPAGAKFADTFATLASWAALGLTVTEASQLPDPNVMIWVGAIGIPFISHPLIKLVARDQFKKTTKVSFTEDTFRMPGLFKAKSFNRYLDHSFVLLPHDKREDEKEALELKKLKARQKGRLARPTKYYGEGFHLVYEHLGERFDITDIYGEKEAKRTLDRLVTIDNVINAMTGAGSGTALNPDNEWNPQAGDLPE